MVEFKYVKTRDVKSPTRGSWRSAGIDFYVPNDFPKTYVQANHDIIIPSGIRALIPEGYMLIGEDKSGVVSSHKAKMAVGQAKEVYSATPGACLKIGAKVIDEDYQGEIHIHLINVGHGPACIEPGQKIAQFILVPVCYAMPEEVSDPKELFYEPTERGEGGFGSTNK